MNVDPLQTEPPTTGKIKLRTSMGDVTIALWSKEAPLACRNIVQLALEGYYEDQIFHRILPGFIVQTGDPTGTGRGGSSIFESEDNPEGEFKDEHHHRLKMTKRGLVAMANAGRPHSNESQFFITLGPTPELQGRHTIFGKVEGPGIYTILSISEVELEDKEVGRPRHPPKLLGIDVIQNPFDDIVPRITIAEKRAQLERARREKQELKEKKRRAALEGDNARGRKKKNATLLSFGEAEEASEEGATAAKLNKKVMSSFDALGAGPSGEPSGSSQARAKSSAKSNKLTPRASSSKESNGTHLPDLAHLRMAHQSLSSREIQEKQVKALEAAIHDQARPRPTLPSSDKGKEKEKQSAGRAWLEEQRDKYSANRERGRKGDDRDAIARLEAFRSKLARMGAEEGNTTDATRTETKRKSEALVADEEIFPEMREYGMSNTEDDDDNWATFRAHRFQAAKKGDEEYEKEKFSVEDYEVIDPRSAAAVRLGFGGKEGARRLREETKREGKRGRDWEDLDSRKYRSGEKRRRSKPSERDAHHLPDGRGAY